jgi:hypothetical protein
MSGYTLYIKTKLMVPAKDPKAMAAASDLLHGGKLAAALNELGFVDIEIDPTYRPKLKADAVY